MGGWCAAHPPTARLRMAGRALYRPGATLRTGLTHFFERRASADRSAVGRFWAECSSGAFGEPTPGVCPGFVQTNMVCVQKEHAYDFLQFCLRNPQPCPLLDVSEVGVPEAPLAAPGAGPRARCSTGSTGASHAAGAGAATATVATAATVTAAAAATAATATAAAAVGFATQPWALSRCQLSTTDLRNAVPKYRVWRDGEMVLECPSVEDVWAETGDMVCFLLGTPSPLRRRRWQ